MRLLFIYFSLVLTMSLSAEVYSADKGLASYSQKQKTTPEVEISVTDNKIRVNNAIVGSKLEIYSVVGVKVVEFEIKYTSGDYAINLAKGYYIVRIGETVRKIVIR